MTDQAGNGWQLRISGMIDDLRAEQTMTRERIGAITNERDDWNREQDIKRLLFEKDQTARMQVMGLTIAELTKIAESLKGQLEALDLKLDQHANSHKQRDKEQMDRVQALHQERIKARTALWIQILVIAGAALVALINLIPHFIK